MYPGIALCVALMERRWHYVVTKYAHCFIAVFTCYSLPYMAKLSKGKKFVVFMIFHSIVNLFRQIMALLIGNITLQACYYKSFPHEYLFSIINAKVLPYTDIYSFAVMCFLIVLL